MKSWAQKNANKVFDFVSRNIDSLSMSVCSISWVLKLANRDFNYLSMIGCTLKRLIVLYEGF